MALADRSSDDTGSATVATPTITSHDPRAGRTPTPRKPTRRSPGPRSQTGSEVDRRLRLMLFRVRPPR